MGKRMVTLEPMNSEGFTAWQANAIATYAADKKASGAWGEDAVEKARAEHARLLPLGNATPDNHLFNVRDPRTGAVVGNLWIALGAFGAPRENAWVFDVVIAEKHRGQGYGRAAMEALEAFARTLGVAEIGLHVFGHNAVARGLYESLGFETKSVVMAKRV